MTAIPIARTVAELRQAVAGLRASGRQVGFVPTMGALHQGHISLGKLARSEGAAVVYSIFVNPAQFAPHEDFDRYPRNLVSDAGMLSEAGVADLIFAPDRHVMYPEGFSSGVTVGGPSQGLESDFRPHFFAGVAIVVAKLLNQAGADFAVFGEKDYQQLQVVTRMAADLNIPTRIVGAPIVREPDGLAMSSRNAYLSPVQRAIAGKLNLVMKDVIERVRRGDTPDHATAFGFGELLAAGFDKVDYIELRDAASLEPVHDLTRPARLLAAVHVGATRLIDNMAA